MAVDNHPIGNDAYLWYDADVTPRKTRCAITAHGNFTYTLNAPMKLGINPPLILKYYSPHWHSVTDVGLGPLRDAAPTETHTSDTSPDYVLIKYTNTAKKPKHNHTRETYATVKYGAGFEDFDIITIKNRFHIGFIHLSTLLRQLQAAGHTNYTEILCFFCRGFLDPVE